MPAAKVHSKETVDKLIASEPQVVVAVTFGTDADFHDVLPKEFPNVTFVCLDFDLPADRAVCHDLGITSATRILHYVKGEFKHQDTGDRAETLESFRKWLAEN